MDEPKYSRPEIERRWLIDTDATEGLLEGAPRVIRDKYLSDTRLRLRRITSPDGEQIYKFCKKYGNRRGAAESITNIYLSQMEYDLLDRLAGTTVTKSRHPQPVGSIDVYRTARGPLCVFEVEFSSASGAAHFQPPEFVDREITGDVHLTGFALAQLCPD